MPIEFEISDVFQTTAETLYHAWLDSESHSQMTGGKAAVSDKVGGEFSAWDGYISGKNLALQPPLKVVQSWRTSDFSDSEEDSLLELTFSPEDQGTRLIIRHCNLPEHGLQYRQGWVEAYFNPMKSYFR